MGPCERDVHGNAQVFEKHDHVKDANITCTITSGGKREVFHYRILPGVSEMRSLAPPHCSRSVTMARTSGLRDHSSRRSESRLN